MTGKLEPTNSPYAIAKITGIEIGRSIKKQFGHNILNLMPTNLYGPNDNYNSEKILKMVLLHDLAESKIGDFTPEQITKSEKEKIENDAFYDIIETLPNSIKLSYTSIWKEYQNQISVEAKIVHQIDRLEMALQAKMYEKSGSSKENIATFLQTAKSDITHPKLKELFTKIVEDQ